MLQPKFITQLTGQMLVGDGTDIASVLLSSGDQLHLLIPWLQLRLQMMR
jgi:hypothetical protein